MSRVSESGSADPDTKISNALKSNGSKYFDFHVWISGSIFLIYIKFSILKPHNRTRSNLNSN